MWKPKPGYDYSKYYGKNVTVCYNTSGIEYDEKEDKVTNGILLDIIENRCGIVSVILSIKTNSNTNYYYDMRNTICGELIQKIKIEDKDIETVVQEICNDVIGVSDLHHIVLDFQGKFIEI